MTDYQLIRETDYRKFNMAVNNFLKDEAGNRWELYGDTYIKTEKIDNVDITVYYQVMIK